MSGMSDAPLGKSPGAVRHAVHAGFGGLTALAARQYAGLPFSITHAPGALPVTDLSEEATP